MNWGFYWEMARLVVDIPHEGTASGIVKVVHSKKAIRRAEKARLIFERFDGVILLTHTGAEAKKMIQATSAHARKCTGVRDHLAACRDDGG